MTRHTFSRWTLTVVAAALGGWVLPTAAQERPAPATSTSGFECLAGEVSGVKTADGQTAVGIVCHELERVSGRVGRYRVSLRTLGYSVMLEVERLDAAGRLMATLAGVEEVTTAAPRIAVALVRNEPLSKSQRVGTLLWDETRQTPLKEGKLSFGLGALGLAAPGQGVATGGGFSLSMSYNAPDFSVPVQFRVAGGGGDDGGHGAHLVGFDVGMRWMTSRRDVSPFVGGGMGWLSWRVDESTDYEYWPRTASYSGAAPFVEVGVELLRLHRSRVSASLRADLPLQNVMRPEGEHWEPRADKPTIVPGHSFYAVPVTLGVTVAF
jgi:hypothetical protein